MSAQGSSRNMTLQERIKSADYLARELSEHLRQAYIPKLTALRSAAKVLDPDQVSDRQIFDRAVAVLEAEEFTAEIHDKLHDHMTRIIQQSEVELLGRSQGTPNKPSSNPKVDFGDLM